MRTVVVGARATRLARLTQSRLTGPTTTRGIPVSRLGAKALSLLRGVFTVAMG